MTKGEVLHGGVANAGQVVRVGDHVLRPANPHSPTIHAFLRHLRAAAFEGASEPVAIEGARERLVFVPGQVYASRILPDRALASAAALLGRYHSAAVGFVPPPGATWNDEMADPSGEHEVICHNDICPENVVVRAGRAVAFIDFDFASPGRRLWDLASFARMCVPVDGPSEGGPSDPFMRLRMVADAYGLPPGRHELLAVLGAQIDNGGAFVRRRVEAGEPAFVRMWQDMGGAARYDNRRAWFAANLDRFEATIG